MVFDNHFFIVLVSLILIYFLWMDLALYYKLQSGYEDLLVVQAYEALNASVLGRNVTTPAPPEQPIMAYYDPFDPISVKLLMLDHLNHYIYYPACWWLDTNLLHVSDRMLFITPDMISMSHVLVAAVGAKCIVSESLSQRRIGVVLFELRSMLDSYDGMVARARSHTRAMTQVSGSWGYWMDGICDAIGTLFFFAGCWILLQKRHMISRRLKPSSGSGSDDGSLSRSSSTENLFSVEEGSPFIAASGSSSSPGSTVASRLFRLSSITICALLAQQFFSSLFWNRYMQGFHRLLEVPSATSAKAAELFQVNTLKSSPFWIISWSWKILNPHSQMSFLLCFVFFDCAGSIFLWLRYLGFIPLFALVACSEVHMQTIMWHTLTAAAAATAQ